MKLALKLLTMIAGLLLLAGVMGYLGGAFDEQIIPGQVAAPEPVKAEIIGEVTKITEPVLEEAPGTVRARTETTLSSRIVASIISISVRAGDSVEEGQVLVRLDDAELKARVSQAEQALRAVQAQLANAESEYERMREQFEAGVVARATLDQAEAQQAMLKAEVERSRRALEEAEAALGHATVLSPINGRVVDRYAEPGDTASPGVPIIRLYDPSSLRLEADVRESIATRLRHGDMLSVRIDALDLVVPVQVNELVPQSDAASRAFIVKVTLPTREQLYPGMFGRLMIPTGETERLYIPERAVLRVGQLEYVYAVTDGKPLRRFIRSGRNPGDGRLEVLSGLEPGEKLAAPGPIENN